MVTKANVLLQCLSEVREAASEWIDHDDVRPLKNDDDTTYPSIVYRFDSNVKRYGEGSQDEPVGEVLNDSGEQIAELYQEFERLHIDLKINSHDIAKTLAIYEALRQQFVPYEKYGEFANDFHDECNDVAVGGSNSDDDATRDPTTRSDILPIEIEFYRYIRRDGTPIRDVHTTLTEMEGGDEYTTFVT